MTTKTTQIKTTYTFSHAEVIEALIAIGALPGDGSATITQAYVRVPGGGDWSNTNLDLCDHPLIVTTEDTKITQS